MCGIKTKEAEYATAVKPPLLVHLRDTDNYVEADCEQFYLCTNVILELYTAKDNFTDERKLENWLRDNKICFQKVERVYYSEEKFYKTEYEISIELNAPED